MQAKRHAVQRDAQRLTDKQTPEDCKGKCSNHINQFSARYPSLPGVEGAMPFPRVSPRAWSTGEANRVD
jgi:hypothetical protein